MVILGGRELKLDFVGSALSQPAWDLLTDGKKSDGSGTRSRLLNREVVQTGTG